MTTVTLASSKPPITLTSGRGITITIDRSVSTSSGGGSGTVTSVTGSAPVVITGTATVTPNVTITAVTTVASGVMSSADKVKLDGVGTGATVTGVTGTLPISSSGGAAPVISIAAVTTVAAGSMSSADKVKLDSVSANAAVSGVTGTLPISSSGGAAPVISIAAATTSAAGSMSSADFTKLSGIGTGATVTGVTGTAPIVSSGGAAPAISVTTGFAASTVAAGNDARIITTPIYVTQQYTANTSNASTTSGITSNRLYYLPYLITTSTTFDRIAIEHLGAVGGASSVVRLGIYSSTSSLPSTLVLDAGTIDLTTAIAFKTITINQTLTPGLYFLAVVAQVTSGSPTFRTAPPTIVTPDTANINSGSKFETATGTLPSTATPGASNTTTIPIAWMRKT